MYTLQKYCEIETDRFCEKKMPPSETSYELFSKLRLSTLIIIRPNCERRVRVLYTPEEPRAREYSTSYVVFVRFSCRPTPRLVVRSLVTCPWRTFAYVLCTYVSQRFGRSAWSRLTTFMDIGLKSNAKRRTTSRRRCDVAAGAGSRGLILQQVARGYSLSHFDRDSFLLHEIEGAKLFCFVLLAAADRRTF